VILILLISEVVVIISHAVGETVIQLLLTAWCSFVFLILWIYIVSQKTRHSIFYYNFGCSGL